MSRKQRLELTWIGKDEHPRLEPRILLENAEKSYHAKERITDDDIFDNRLIFGDNLLALKALEADFTGKVNCVYIDPPYNTGSAFAHYDDGLEHSIWLGLMRDRIQVIHRLLHTSGCFFVQADDNEGHYLKIICDEIFGRKNFIATFLWKKVDSPNDNKVPVTPDHEFIFGYAKSAEDVKLRQRPDSSLLDAYLGPDENGLYYRDRLLKKNGKNSLRTDRPSMWFPIPGPDGIEVYPIHDDGREARWAFGKAAVLDLIAKNEIIWKDRGTESTPKWVPYKREFASSTPSRPFPTLWTDLPTTRQTKAHQKELFGAGNEFDTPKPEALIERVLQLSTNPGDLILDSFAGSGTTGAVAHKMGRRWIMVELGAHCHTHIIPRLGKVIDGNDPGGITEAVEWKGGGGFRYYALAPSLMEKDRWGNWVIAKTYNAPMLAEAVCKLMGFTYAPSESRYWMHGRSSEQDYIYVTTQSLTHEQLAAIADEVGEKRTLLICCKAFRANTDAFSNLTIRKIPQTVLRKCEWNKDDYSLNVANLPMATQKSNRESALQHALFGDEA
ncbi:MAG: site-specific DNA-methyltransferase [Acidobacteriales bacterium]|nr:site-specific DNA-methyltransferase [Terriglobales bacterium]